LAGRDFGESELNEARDMFLFSFYARGMSFVDMCYLRKTKVWNEALHYERQKTHQVFSVALTPQLREIIFRYDDPGSPWVLPCMQRGMLSSANKQEDMNGDVPPASLYNFYCMALHYYLILLKEISRRLGCRNLTFNVARHTWATEARSMGVPTPHISEGLGHTSERTTRIYLASLDRQTVDEVNERVTKL
ncbi:tyrosine-type recombinase/integrase, partial [Proteus mirabilis]|nr:tyrosine-type recombinase/integrase [Proteus mirabilis]